VKKSELKSIIRECIEELYLDESGPADRHRRKTHYKYKQDGLSSTDPNFGVMKTLDKKSGLRNIMKKMEDEGRPLSFIKAYPSNVNVNSDRYTNDPYKYVSHNTKPRKIPK